MQRAAGRLLAGMSVLAEQGKKELSVERERGAGTGRRLRLVCTGETGLQQVRGRKTPWGEGREHGAGVLALWAWQGMAVRVRDLAPVTARPLTPVRGHGDRGTLPRSPGRMREWLE